MIIAFLFGIVTFARGFNQYKVEQKWKRAEFISKQMAEYTNNEMVISAIRMMDYDGRTIDFGTVQAPHIVVVGHRAERNADGSFRLAAGRPTLEAALRHHRFGLANDDEIEIRDRFDVILLYYERFERFLQDGLCTPEELSPYVKYHVALMNGRVEHSRHYQAQLFQYIVSYGFANALAFLQRFERSDEVIAAIGAAQERAAGNVRPWWQRRPLAAARG